MKINDVVFTDHAIERLHERGIKGNSVWQTVNSPDSKNSGKEQNTTEFRRKIDNRTITAICKKNNIGEWVVLSAWMDPPLEGTADFTKKQKYQDGLRKDKEYNKKIEKASFWGKLWLTFKKQADF